MIESARSFFGRARLSPVLRSKAVKFRLDLFEALLEVSLAPEQKLKHVFGKGRERKKGQRCGSARVGASRVWNRPWHD
jgi:hypothetical protein